MSEADELAALRAIVDDLKKTVDDQGATIADQAAALAQQAQEQAEHAPEQIPPPTPTVIVKLPSQTKLGIFTGLDPKGGQEIAYHEWKGRVETYLLETTDKDEAYRRVLASLKGLALSQVKSAKSAEEIVKTLTSLYGPIDSTEDRYLKFVEMRPNKGEKPSQFFVRLWDAFNKLNKENVYSSDATKQKIYHAFSNALKSKHTLLVLELRNKFGTPGSSQPDMSEVLRKTREIETDDTSVSANAHASQSVSDGIDYDKLSTMVAEKLSCSSRPPPQALSGAIPFSHNPPLPQFPFPASGHPSPFPKFQSSYPPPQSARPKGPCYKCGEVGTHYKRDCNNPPNPKRVQDEKKRLANLNGR